MDSKQLDPATSKERSQEEPSLPKSYTVAIEQSINKALKQVDFKSRRSGSGSGSGGGSSARSDKSSHKCGKNVHFKKDFRSKVNGYGRNSPKKSANELTEWFTKKPVVSDTKYVATSTMTHNQNQY